MHSYLHTHETVVKMTRVKSIEAPNNPEAHGSLQGPVHCGRHANPNCVTNPSGAGGRQLSSSPEEEEYRGKRNNTPSLRDLQTHSIHGQPPFSRSRGPTTRFRSHLPQRISQQGPSAIVGSRTCTPAAASHNYHAQL